MSQIQLINLNEAAQELVYDIIKSIKIFGEPQVDKIMLMGSNHQKTILYCECLRLLDYQKWLSKFPVVEK